MVKAKARGADGKEIVILGITKGNVERLIKGEPIRVRGSDLEMDSLGSIMVIYAEDEAKIEDEMRRAGLITERTKVKIDPRLKSKEN